MLTKKQILKYLRQLADELEARGLHGEILLTGGAAMCLVHEARDMTKDIDALYEPKSIINQLATVIAKREDLPGDWLNDSVKGFVGENAPVEDFITFGSLSIQTVSTEYLLAMKMMSARYGEKDSDDILFLMNKLGIKTTERAIEILLTFFPRTQILPKTQYVIEEMIERIQEQDKHNEPSLLAELAEAKEKIEREKDLSDSSTIRQQKEKQQDTR